VPPQLSVMVSFESSLFNSSNNNKSVHSQGTLGGWATSEHSQELSPGLLELSEIGDITAFWHVEPFWHRSWVWYTDGWTDRKV